MQVDSGTYTGDTESLESLPVPYTEKKVEPNHGALLEGGAVFSLLIMFRIAPQRELSYGQANSSPRGAILAPFFSHCIPT